MGATTKTSEAIINVLKKEDKPLVIDEIAFKTRSSRSVVNEVMDRLQKAKIVTEDENKYSLNNTNDYELSEAYK